jgi:hypothetical protein
MITSKYPPVIDTKIKSAEEDPDRQWITTWNHYLNHLKYFFRWLYNIHTKTTTIRITILLNCITPRTKTITD